MVSDKLLKVLEISLTKSTIYNLQQILESMAMNRTNSIVIIGTMPLSILNKSKEQFAGLYHDTSIIGNESENIWF